MVKAPGEDRPEPVHLDFSFHEQLGRAPAPYERLLLDAINGDGTLFPRQEAIEETWRILQPLLDAPPPIERYARSGARRAPSPRAGPRRVAGSEARH